MEGLFALREAEADQVGPVAGVREEARTGNGRDAAAADELVIPRATLSRRLAKLEERLGVRLMHRTTRQQILTALGEEFYIHARSILTAVEVARHAITQDEEHPHGPLRISVPTLASSGLDNLFLDFLDKGLVYRKNAVVNWDPVDMTVLANEQVIDGKGWRSGADVVRRELTQWFFKISDFSEDLLEAIQTIETACDETRNSERLRKMMATILTLVNQINTGGEGKVAAGFGLDALLKLNEVSKSSCFLFICSLQVTGCKLVGTSSGGLLLSCTVNCCTLGSLKKN